MKTPSVRRLVSLAAALLLLSVLWSAALGADGVTVEGTLYYSTTPVAGIPIELRRDSGYGALIATTTSGPTGAYEFTGVPSGTHALIPLGAVSGYMDGPLHTVAVASADVAKDLYLERPIALLEPADGSVVTTRSLRYCWVGLPMASQYYLQVNRSSDWALAEYKTNIADTCYTTTVVLDTGVQYTWMVEAMDSAGHRLGRTEDTFRFTWAPAELRMYLPLALRQAR